MTERSAGVRASAEDAVRLDDSFRASYGWRMGVMSGTTGGYAVALLQSIVGLAGVCALAVVLLRLAASRGLGRAPAGKALQLVERLPLDARSSACLVKVGARTYLLGVADGSAPRLLAEIPESELMQSAGVETTTRSFREVLASLRPDRSEPPRA